MVADGKVIDLIDLTNVDDHDPPKVNPLKLRGLTLEPTHDYSESLTIAIAVAITCDLASCPAT